MTPIIHQHLADVFQRLGLHGTIEFSLKITPHSFNPLRYVMGVDAARMHRSELQFLLSYFNPSYEVAESVLELSAEATMFFFGQEGYWSSGCRRLYVECWNRVDLAQGAHSCRVMDAWKWRSGQCQDWVMSRYSVMTRLGPEAICNQFVDFAAAVAPRSSLPCQLRTLLSTVASDGLTGRFPQLWCTEDFSKDGLDLGRMTLDLNLLDYQLPLGTLNGIRSGLEECFPMSCAGLSNWLSLVDGDQYNLSHLAIGRDRNCLPYFTVYFVEQP